LEVGVLLGGGAWNGRRLLSKAWVDESTSFHSRFDPRYSLGAEHQYGYGWHINFLKSGGKTYRVLSAGGNGGQFVIVVPDLDLVVGMNGGSYAQFDRWYRWELDLVPNTSSQLLSGSFDPVSRLEP
jgi:CubicO group peptidase (beta-lactamase class C family)